MRIALADDGAVVWLIPRKRLYSLRTGASLLKDPASRRNTLSAATRQLEEQMIAAKAVTPATRPLNLYYARRKLAWLSLLSMRPVSGTSAAVD